MTIRTLFRMLTMFLMASTVLVGCRLGGRGASSSDQNPPSATELQGTGMPADGLANEALNFHEGRNDFTVSIDDTPREFIVYVPAGYDANKPTPVVFMFHGTNGTGAEMYDYTTWVKKAHDVNTLVVFPTSWRYPLLAENRVVGKWNDATLQGLTGAEVELKDDVKFTRMLVEMMKSTFNVDAKRIFATGFSNGGSFVQTRLLVQMNDTFGAFTVSGSGTKFGEPVFADNMPPKISTSFYILMGTQDEMTSEGQGIPVPFPIDPEKIFNHAIFGATLVNSATYLSLDPAKYQILPSDPAYTIFVFDQSLIGASNEFIFQMVDDMHHIYPNGRNNTTGLDAADIFWEFFLKHPLN